MGALHAMRQTRVQGAHDASTGAGTITDKGVTGELCTTVQSAISYIVRTNNSKNIMMRKYDMCSESLPTGTRLLCMVKE